MLHCQARSYPGAMPGAGYDAIVLAGGSGSRMDGADKASLTIAGTTLLDRVLAAVGGAATVVVVGAATSHPTAGHVDPRAPGRHRPGGGHPRRAGADRR